MADVVDNADKGTEGDENSSLDANQLKDALPDSADVVDAGHDTTPDIAPDTGSDADASIDSETIEVVEEWTPDEYSPLCKGGMCLIPAGPFKMGCNVDWDDRCQYDEVPYRQVTLAEFYIDREEVSASSYWYCSYFGGCTSPANGDYCNYGASGWGDHPMNCLTWEQASAYCRYRGKRLPTEAEWEKAARGTDGRRYPWGDEAPTCDLAVIPACYGGMTDSCSKSPRGDSPYGVCDMAGNVWEFVSDWYADDYYKWGPTTDPVGPLTGDTKSGRGGSFDSDGGGGGLGLRVSDRHGFSRQGHYAVGFRCASDESPCIKDCEGRECGVGPLCGDVCGICDDADVCVSNTCVYWVPDTYSIQCGADGMCLVPPGPFYMGCNGETDIHCSKYADEQPYHEVYMSGYYMDRTEVRQSDYKKCVDAGKCVPPSNCSSYDPAANAEKPMICVDRKQAAAYCAWKGRRLPTEAEWEKAARGTDGRAFPWGVQLPTCYEAVFSGCTDSVIKDVCSKSPKGDSPYGLCDMAGNVEEWTSDWYGVEYYSSSPSLDPTGPGTGTEAVFRGGDYSDYDWLVRVSERGKLAETSISSGRGFRCARDL